MMMMMMMIIIIIIYNKTVLLFIIVHLSQYPVTFSPLYRSIIFLKSSVLWFYMETHNCDEFAKYKVRPKSFKTSYFKRVLCVTSSGRRHNYVGLCFV
jgi:hypothetical protein